MKKATSKVSAHAYDPAKIEKKWQERWSAEKIYQTKESSRQKKYYVLDMFPYPSGEGLHVGHPKGYIATDIISRYRRMNGRSVLHPMGFDAFGLPAENYALQTKTNPAEAVKKNVARYKKQLELLGFDYDWSREINTTDPAYYKWTQWIFLELWKKGLAFESYEPINWCPVDKTGLANEDIENGRCERCGSLVEKRPLRQWVLRITDYADRLLDDLDAYDPASLAHVIDKKNPPRKGKKLIGRRTVHALVRDPKNGKFLGLKWKTHPWVTYIVGGVENGEDIVQAALREVEEETGYTDIKFVKVLGAPVLSDYYAAHKDVNRRAMTSGVLFELVSDKRKDISATEAEAHDVIWMEPAEINPENMTCAELPIWQKRLPSSAIDTTKAVPVFTQVWDSSAVKENHPFIERNAVMVIVKHWSEDKYIGLKWKKVDWQTLITGGIEGGQSAQEAAAAEITEETGYANPVFVKELGRFDSKFFHNPKQENRWAHFNVPYFELKDGQRKEISEKEKEIHEVVWLPKAEMEEFLTALAQKYAWSGLFLGMKDEWQDQGRKLLDWPESIKELQKNWIGRSEGALIHFPLPKRDVNFVLLHGWEGSPEHNFFPWLKIELEKQGYRVQVPALPSTTKPKVREQVEKVLKTCTFDEKTVLLGHSLGGTVAMKVLEKLPQAIDTLVLAASFIKNRFKDGTHFEKGTHDWKYDFENIRSKAKKILILRDRSDSVVFDDQALNLQKRLGGVLIDFKAEKEHITGTKEPSVLSALVPGISVFTTRPDTLFGATYLVLAPEHKMVKQFLSDATILNGTEVEEYISRAARETEIVRTSTEKEKTGVELKGLRAVNPATKEEVPVWIADYVLPDYGTGAIMAVPAHDRRDFTFAKKFGLPIKMVVCPNYPDPACPVGDEPFIGEGHLVGSGKFDGLRSSEAKRAITDSVGGKTTVIYKLRDWVFSRQRYWGEPIPLIHCAECGVVPVPEKDLPVLLPKVKSYEPTGTGESPLATIAKWVNVKCPNCRGSAKRETNTMPQWAGSCWYYLRYEDPKNTKRFVDEKREKYWSPVDLYVGGAEHATRHLIYSRFWHKVLYDLGEVSANEPFMKLRHVGLIMGEDGRKMSKRFGNVVNPDQIVKAYGADTLRLYTMFMGPFDQQIAWSTSSMAGARRFIEKIWKLRTRVETGKTSADHEIERTLHKTAKKVGEDIEDFRFNTAVSALMIAVGRLEKTEWITRGQYEALLRLLAPFAPHAAEELWRSLGNKKSIHLAGWPKYDPKIAADEELTVVVQVNGKLRGSFTAAVGTEKRELEEQAAAVPEVKKWLEDKAVKKVIVVPDRLVNFIV
ncbi:MAG: leucyl-tRNA synthetase [Candidatus Parcubacteria bacterium]|jgi:leucyl-tRNA synthetase|nr:leucyl-tRNA synthetase [Candidatus Parcubacteria bacterium]